MTTAQRIAWDASDLSTALVAGMAFTLDSMTVEHRHDLDPNRPLSERTSPVLIGLTASFVGHVQVPAVPLGWRLMNDYRCQRTPGDVGMEPYLYQYTQDWDDGGESLLDILNADTEAIAAKCLTIIREDLDEDDVVRLNEMAAQHVECIVTRCVLDETSGILTVDVKVEI